MARYPSYSRLNWAEERRLRRKVWFLGTISVLLLVAFVVWGIPNLFNLISSVRNSGDRLSSGSDTLAPAQPFIFALPQATNSAELFVSGTSESDAKVEINVNGRLQTSTTSDKSGLFKSSRIVLSDGSNNIKVIATDKAGNRSLPSQELKIIFDNTKPQINIDQPQDGQKFVGVRQQNTTISGKINKRASLAINQRFVYVSPDGSFTTSLSLSNGENLIIAIATDSAGNYDTRQIKVTFEP
ncbi:MAG: hypothetical protein UW69_C0008G0025 [Microgenomates group bacterium GW2011_GWA2_44_7]|uniref:Uncharacterized protein n=1 Tax=Candidatus Woesebacteria bacterium GW2011_GWA1_43_12 TaxID=1618557 RepID=A0A0G1F5U7_9BACT|nr:MAG: hypothetical protein UV66_C0002G0038 [Candidatus Woesebacteria bacterium GW2011_GWA1_43_12]KKT75874.1 MAG: hypothetical protein UW69_C0008G0025 [Microgenomates group bacterium GW2011_GWA2_44_7]KKT78506.1 MAG: hypothetical protein UW73_C0002G0037 [Microgenomates group bacterium GW2011_GWB1_44_8]